MLLIAVINIPCKSSLCANLCRLYKNLYTAVGVAGNLSTPTRHRYMYMYITVTMEVSERRET